MRQLTDLRDCTNPLGPSSKTKNALRKGINHLHAFPAVKAAALRRYIARSGGIGEANILLGCGATHLLDLFLRAWHPALVTTPGPVSCKFRRVLGDCNAEPLVLTSRCEGEPLFDTETFLRLVGDGDAVILPNPHNITGRLLAGDDLARVMEETEKKGRMLVIDETFLEFTGSASPLREAVASKGTIILRSFSIFHGLAGLRLGYAIGPETVLDRIRAMEPGYGINAAGCEAALASLKDRGFRNRTAKFIFEEKQYFLKKLAPIKSLHVLDTACNFLLLALDQPPGKVKAQLLGRGVLIDEFEDEKGVVFMRLPIRTHRLNARIARLLTYITREYKV
jgi:threonine-phosphate decarboxylase